MGHAIRKVHICFMSCAGKNVFICVQHFTQSDQGSHSQLTESLYVIDLMESKDYSKYPKISYTKVSDKMSYANSADPDQTAPEGAV